MSKRAQRTLRGAIVALVTGLLVAGGSIYYLLDEVDFAKGKQKELESRSISLVEEVQNLKDLKLSLESDLIEREERINSVSDRLGDLEKVLGVGESGGEIESRLDAAAITSSVRMIMLTQIPSGSPVNNARISSHYGSRTHPVTGKKRMHRGTDYAVNTGTPIYAPADGVVEVVRPSKKGSGNFLRVQHSYGFSSSYSHLNKFAVKSGEFVKKGDLIAYSGNSGLSSGPHLHYEIRFVGRALDAKPFINWGVDEFESIFKEVRGVRWEPLVNSVEERVSTQLKLSSQIIAKSDDGAS